MKTRGSATFSEQERLQAVRLLYQRLIRAFSPYFWKARVHPMLAGHPQFHNERPVIILVKNACVEAALMSLRDIDTFFIPRSRNTPDTDLRASDFPAYTGSGPFLSRAERDSINQWLVHLTWQPILQKMTGLGDEPSLEWNIADFIGKAARAVFQFLDRAYPNLGPVQPEWCDELRTVRKMLEQALKNMEALAEFERVPDLPPT